MYVFGKNVAIETLNSNQKIKKVYLDRDFREDRILGLLAKKNVKVEYLLKRQLDQKVKGLHQGIILEIEDYHYAPLESILEIDDPLIVILDHIEDPHNFGAIIRTCEAAGVDGIIIPNDRSVEVNGTVVKTSVGTTEKVKIARVTNIVNTIKELKKRGFWIFGTDMEGSDYSTLDYRGNTAIICGNEGKGMSRLVEENCDFIATIPMQGTVNSLNASVATAIIVFEAVNQEGGNMNYQDFNDYELISYAYESDEEARNILLKKYEPLIASIVSRMIKSCSYMGLEKSDLMQEGLIGLNHAIEYFNEQKDITFYTYAKTCIERRLISVIVAAKRLKHKALNESISLDIEEEDVSFDKILKDNSSNPEEIVMDTEKTEFLISEIRQSLTDFELQVFELMLSYFTYREIAEILDKDKKQIDNAIQRIKGKVKEKLKDIN